MKKLLTTALVTGVLATAASVAAAGEIAVIVKTTNSSFWQNVNKGASAAIEGISEHTMTFNGPASESAIADQVALVENAINRGVAAIVLAPSDRRSWRGSGQRYCRHHDRRRRARPHRDQVR